jgi:hypothetical protein
MEFGAQSDISGKKCSHEFGYKFTIFFYISGLGQTVKYPMSITYEKYLPKKNYLKAQQSTRDLEKENQGRFTKTTKKITEVDKFYDNRIKAKATPQNIKSSSTKKYSESKKIERKYDPVECVRNSKTQANSKPSKIKADSQKFMYEESMREAGLKKYDKDYKRVKRAMSISSSSLSSSEGMVNDETDSVSDLNSDDLESECDCSSCREGSCGSDKNYGKRLVNTLLLWIIF